MPLTLLRSPQRWSSIPDYVRQPAWRLLPPRILPAAQALRPSSGSGGQNIAIRPPQQAPQQRPPPGFLYRGGLEEQDEAFQALARAHPPHQPSILRKIKLAPALRTAIKEGDDSTHAAALLEHLRTTAEATKVPLNPTQGYLLSIPRAELTAVEQQHRKGLIAWQRREAFTKERTYMKQLATDHGWSTTSLKKPVESKEINASTMRSRRWFEKMGKESAQAKRREYEVNRKVNAMKRRKGQQLVPGDGPHRRGEDEGAATGPALP